MDFLLKLMLNEKLLFIISIANAVYQLFEKFNNENLNALVDEAYDLLPKNIKERATKSQLKKAINRTFKLVEAVEECLKKD